MSLGLKKTSFETGQSLGRKASDSKPPPYGSRKQPTYEQKEHEEVSFGMKKSTISNLIE